MPLPHGVYVAEMLPEDGDSPGIQDVGSLPWAPVKLGRVRKERQDSCMPTAEIPGAA